MGAMRACNRCGSTENGFYPGQPTICRVCQRARANAYRAKNRGKVQAYSREYNNRPDVKKRKRKWQKARAPHIAAYMRRRVYGLTAQQYQAMLDAQRGLCAICGIDPSAAPSKWKSLCVDHCHKTGAVRGLLCHGCNRAIGFIREDPSIAVAMGGYLERQHSS